MSTTRVKQQLSSADRLRSVIARRLGERNLSLRWVERRYGLGHGTLGNLVRGKSRFGLDHLDMFADLFEIVPAELLAEAYEASPHAKHTSPLPSHLVDPDRLKSLLREAVGELLRQAQGGDFPAEPTAWPATH